MGWLTVLAYIFAFVLTGLAAAKCSRNAVFWATVCLLMLLLGGGKIINFDSILADTLRNVAYHDGWYAERRAVQEIFVTILLAAGTAAGLLLGFRQRRVRWEVMLAGIAIIGLVIFKGVKFASLHGIDAALGFSILGLSTSGLVENAFILLISTCAAWVVGWPSKKSRSQVRVRDKTP